MAFAALRLKNAPYMPIRVFRDLPTDPLSSITSVLAKMRPGEAAAIQVLIQPAEGKWRENGRSYISKIKKAGYRLVCAEDVFIHHFQQGTFKLIAPDVYKRIFETNRKRYEDKWGQWTPHKPRNFIHSPKSRSSNASIEQERVG